jgi:hypothetical protein
VLLKTVDWAAGTYLQSFTDVWGDLLKTPVIANKLKNFGGIRATMHVKVSISSSPFYAGLAMATFNVLPGSTRSYPVTLGNEDHLVLLSTRPKILISPQDNMGGELTIPFIYPYNFAPLSGPDRANLPAVVADLGTMTIGSTGMLRSFNPSVSSNVTLSIYAWLTDVELTMNTISAVIQSSARKVGLKKKQSGAKNRRAAIMSMAGVKDEYSEAPVSGVASAVAAAAGSLTSVPVIGPFARATEMGAGALANVASWFGFTNVPVIDDHKPYAPKPFPNFASSEIGHPIDRLSLDPKNELTIDTRVCGLDGTDEMSIASIVTRECYLTTFTWSDSQAPSTLLFNTRVTPMLFRIRTGPPDLLWATPMAFVGQMFANWTGDIEFRFIVQATKFHMGRLRVEYEPFVNATDATSQIVNCCEVIDIGESKEFTIVVPYSQLRHWQNVARLGTVGEQFSTSGVVDANRAYDNGMLTVKIQNRLSGPAADNTVDVAVFVRGAPNLAFANPIDLDNTLTFGTIQSSSMECRQSCDMAPEAQDVRWIDSTDDITRLSYGVYMGETILSLRQLMHRTSRYTLLTTHDGPSPVSMLYIHTIDMPLYPRIPGEWASALHRTAAEVGFNYVAYSPMSWMTPCYVGVRGSVNWVANVMGDLAHEVSFTRLYKQRDVNTRFMRIDVVPADSSTSTAARTYLMDVPQGSQSGTVLTNQRTCAGIGANVPYYSTSRFTYTNPGNLTGDGDFLEDYWGSSQGVRLQIKTTQGITTETESTCAVELFTSAGHDFNLIMFKNVPPIYLNGGTLPIASTTWRT